MGMWLMRLTAALLFVVVETLFFVALHTYFARPVDRMKTWFSRHSWRMVLIILPLLFGANLVVSFLFSGFVSPAAPQEGPDSQQTVEYSKALEEALPGRSEPKPDPSPSEPSTPANRAHPIPGVPADNTLQ